MACFLARGYQGSAWVLAEAKRHRHSCRSQVAAHRRSHRRSLNTSTQLHGVGEGARSDGAELAARYAGSVLAQTNPTHRALTPTLKLAIMFTRDYFKPDAIKHDELLGHLDLAQILPLPTEPNGAPNACFFGGVLGHRQGRVFGCTEYKGQGKKTAQAILRFCRRPPQGQTPPVSP